MPLIKAISRHNFATQRLSVVPDLLGQSHTFSFRERQISILIPSRELTDGEYHRADGVSCWKWKTDGTIDVPVAYQVYSIFMDIYLPDPVDVSDEALQLEPTRPELFKPDQPRQLDELAHGSEMLGRQAFSYWLKVLRWKTKLAYIGQPEVSHERSTWGTYLIDAKTQHRFWAPPSIIVSQPKKEVSVDQWKNAQEALERVEVPPLWLDYLFDAIQRLDNGDHAAAVLSAAIGLETVIRFIFSQHIAPASVSNSFVQSVLDRTNIRTIINHRKQLDQWNELNLESAWDNSAFNDLMNSRDAIMHRGDLDVTQKALWETLQKLLEFSYLVDNIFRISCPENKRD